jgi:hypothetical protein
LPKAQSSPTRTETEDIHPIIIEGQGHTALANVSSGGNPALTTLGQSHFLPLRGDKKLGEPDRLPDAQLRADAPITRLNSAHPGSGLRGQAEHGATRPCSAPTSVNRQL